MNVSPELIITFLIGNFVGSFLYRVWRNSRREWPSFPRHSHVANENPPPTYPRPPAPPTPYTSWAAILKERERCAQLAESMDCAWRCRVGQEVGAAIRRQGCGPGQPDPEMRR